MEDHMYQTRVNKWNLFMEALHSKDPERRDGFLAELLIDADNSIRAAAALSDFTESRIDEARRAIAMRRTIERYLKSMGYDGATLALKRRWAQDEARAAYKARQRMKGSLRDAYRFGPEYYAAGVRYYQKEGLL